MKNRFKSVLYTLVLSSVVFTNANLHAKGMDDVPTLLTNNNAREAIVIIRNHLQAEPTDFKAHSKLAEIYFNSHDFIKAEKELLQLKAMNADPEYWLIPLARLYEMNNDSSKILALIDGKVIKNDSAWDRDVNVIRAQALLSKNEIPQAQQYLDAILKADPNHVEALWVLSKIQILSNELDKGEKTLSRAFKALENNANPLLSSKLNTTLAEVHRLNKKPEEAKANYQKAISENQSNLLALLGLTSLYLEQNDKTEFVKSAVTLYNLAPNYPKAMFFMGLAELELKHKDKAINLLEKANIADASDIGTQFVLAKIHYDNKQYERADALLSNVVKKKPNYMPAIGMLGALKMKLNQPEETVKLLTPFVNAETKNHKLLALLGSANVMAGHVQTGSELLQRAASIQPEDAGIKTELALSYLVGGQTELAQNTLDTVVQSDANLLQADVLLIYTQLNKQQYKDAKKTSENLVTKAPNNPVPYNLLGLSYAGLKEYKLAEDNFKKAIANNKTFINAQNNLAEVYQLQKKYSEAKQVLQGSLQEDQNHLDSLLMMAKISELEGNPAEALEWFDKAEDRNREQVTPGLEKVKFYLRHKENKKALSYANKVSSKFSNHPSALNLVAHISLMEGDNSKAANAFGKLTKIQPKQPAHWQGLARADLAINDITAAKVAIEQAMILEPNNTTNKLISAEIAMRSKNYPAALEIGNELLKTVKNPSMVHRLMGDALLASGKPTEAVKAYQKSFDLEKSDDIIHSLYRAQIKAGQVNEAMMLLENQIQSQPNNLVLRRFLATEYFMKGDLDKARQHYDSLIAADPKDYKSLNNLASIYLNTNPSKAVELAMKAYTLMPNNPNVADTLGFALIKNKQAAQGISYIRQAMKVDNSNEVRYHLAVGLNVIGDKNSAKIELKRALETQDPFQSRQDAQLLLENLTKQEG